MLSSIRWIFMNFLDLSASIFLVRMHASLQLEWCVHKSSNSPLTSAAESESEVERVRVLTWCGVSDLMRVWICVWERQRDRETERQRGRETERQRERGTHTHTETHAELLQEWESENIDFWSLRLSTIKLKAKEKSLKLKEKMTEKMLLCWNIVHWPEAQNVTRSKSSKSNLKWVETRCGYDSIYFVTYFKQAKAFFVFQFGKSFT